VPDTPAKNVKMKTKKYSVINYGIAQGDPYFIDQKIVGRFVGNLNGVEWVCYHREENTLRKNRDAFSAMCAAFAKASGEVAV
tara:strand:+ start:98 stop:343 length:246 start_codon:yes stop_codon:yes gene_type:complete